MVRDIADAYCPPERYGAPKKGMASERKVLLRLAGVGGGLSLHPGPWEGGLGSSARVPPRGDRRPAASGVGAVGGWGGDDESMMGPLHLREATTTQTSSTTS